MDKNVLTPKPKKSAFKKVKITIITLAVIGIYVWTFLGIDINWARAIERVVNNFGNIIPKLFSPDWSAAGEVGEMILETIFIAFAGTLMASILAVPLGFLAAKNVTNNYIGTLGKWLLSANRSFPELILAILFIVAV